MRRTVIAATLLWAALAGQACAQSAPSSSAWRAMAEVDVRAAEETLKTHYIYAIYPGGMDWPAVYGPAAHRAELEAKAVKDFAGYRAVLQHFAAAFEDPHLRFKFALQLTNVEWPRFIAAFQDGRYRVAYSETATAPVGAEISACDGRPLQLDVDEAAGVLGGTKGLETTDANVARSLFIDVKNPFLRRPKRCRIGGGEVDLAWISLPADRLAVLQARLLPPKVNEASVTPFGKDGA